MECRKFILRWLWSMLRGLAQRFVGQQEVSGLFPGVDLLTSSLPDSNSPAETMKGVA